jgi:hypothetical protein
MTCLRAHVCWICGRAVALENCKTDEQGLAVHEACYIARLELASESMRLSNIPPRPAAFHFKLDMRLAKRLYRPIRPLVQSTRASLRRP